MSRPFNQVQMNTSTIGGGFFQNNLSYILLGLGVLVIIAVIVYYFVYKPISTTPVVYSENSEHNTVGSSQNNKVSEIMFFYADWCPHCKTAKPIWNDIKSEYENKTINGYKVIFTEVNCTEDNAEIEDLMNKYNVEGFPTIKLLKDGQVIEYDAKPSKETLTQFLNTVH